MSKKGKVYIIGAGPGDPGLITLKGLRCLAGADVVVYDYLASEEILRFAGQGARTLAAIRAGASAASVTVLGLGERAGNAAAHGDAVAAGGEATEASDVYQFGLVLHEALTRENLNGDARTPLAQFHAMGQTEWAPRPVSADLPPDLRDLLAACCAARSTSASG